MPENSECRPLQVLLAHASSELDVGQHNLSLCVPQIYVGSMTLGYVTHDLL
ncbi:hypothetical protein [Escherichia coli]|uniref:hypothetical protein n=1 Tax=Escherichia coli TaxID=562 RepID=UPI003F75EBE2